LIVWLIDWLLDGLDDTWVDTEEWSINEELVRTYVPVSKCVPVCSQQRQWGSPVCDEEEARDTAIFTAYSVLSLCLIS
jgi:hypothetical protein